MVRCHSDRCTCNKLIYYYYYYWLFVSSIFFQRSGCRYPDASPSKGTST
jgi:hypothetical protein